ncbi:MAG: nitronate monooxygenase [Ignavibacteriae bacterium]|nr:nitronate monooxygenase [Ignavibacteriota bacterium]
MAPEIPSPLLTPLSRLLGIRYPIIQGGMVWTAGAKLAVAVSEAGALGVLGAGSMKPDALRQAVRDVRRATNAPFGVNIPLMREDRLALIGVCEEERVGIVITSSGDPSALTPRLKNNGCTVLHVVATVKHARKAADAGCDAVVAEGCEAGGHNGVDEITTLTLVPQVVDAVRVPVVAAGGIADGRGMAAALALGAGGVQVGTRFAATVESDAHAMYKQRVVEATDRDTVLTMRGLMPVRMLRTPFTLRAMDAERRGATREELEALLGSKREKLGIGEGNVEEGMFEAGQSAGLVHAVLPAADVVRTMMHEYRTTQQRMP